MWCFFFECTQASLSVAVLFASYLAHQRVSPYVTLSTAAGTLGLTAGNMETKLAEVSSSASAGKLAPSVRRSTPSSSGSSSKSARRHASRSAPESTSSVASATTGMPDSEDSPESLCLNPQASNSKFSGYPGANFKRVLIVAQRVQGVFKRLLFAGFINYNILESSFLIVSISILLLGMVFASGGFAVGSFPYECLGAVTAIIIVVSTSSFVCLLAFEVYRSVKLASFERIARAAEIEQLEKAFHAENVYRRQSRQPRRSSGSLGGTALAVPNRRASLLLRLGIKSQDSSSLLQRVTDQQEVLSEPASASNSDGGSPTPGDRRRRNGEVQVQKRRAVRFRFPTAMSRPSSAAPRLDWVVGGLAVTASGADDAKAPPRRDAKRAARVQSIQAVASRRSRLFK